MNLCVCTGGVDRGYPVREPVEKEVVKYADVPVVMYVCTYACVCTCACVCVFVC